MTGPTSLALCILALAASPVLSQAASSTTLGTGCSPLVFQPQLNVDAPVMGQDVDITLQDLPLADVTLFVSAGPPSPSAVLPGCTIWVDLQGMVPFQTFVTGHAGVAWTTVFVPWDPSLAGMQLTLQAAGLMDIYPNPLVLGVTNGVHVTVGQ